MYEYLSIFTFYSSSRICYILWLGQNSGPTTKFYQATILVNVEWFQPWIRRKASTKIKVIGSTILDKLEMTTHGQTNAKTKHQTWLLHVILLLLFI